MKNGKSLLGVVVAIAIVLAVLVTATYPGAVVAATDIPPLPEPATGANDLTPMYENGELIYPLLPDKSKFGEEQVIFSIEIPADILLDATCETLDNPFIDPATWGDMDAQDNHARLDVVYCDGSFYFRAWSVWAGRPPMTGDWNLQRLSLDWQLVNLTDNHVQTSGHLEATENPVVEGAPTSVEGEVSLPVTGKTYRLDVLAYVRQLGCDNGSGQVSSSTTQVAPVGTIDILKTDQDGNPVPDVIFELWGRNKDGEWELLSTKATNTAGEVSFAAPQNNYKVVEQQESLPPMSYPLMPASGETDEFIVDATNPVVSIVFVNHVPHLLYLPLLNKAGEPALCTRQARIAYVDRTGLYQSVVRNFTETGAEVFSVGVLPYARVLSIEMMDGQQVELMTIQSITPNGGRYDYTDDRGPDWNYAGTWEWDQNLLPPDVTWRNVVDVHNFIAEYHEGDVLCTLNVQAQWDPPELQALRQQLHSGNITPTDFYKAAAFLLAK